MRDDEPDELLPSDEDQLAARRAARSGRAGHANNPLGSNASAGQMPCRRCRVPVEVSEAGLEAFRTMAAHLVARGEAALLPDQVMLCATCRGLLRAHAAVHARRTAEKLAAAVRTLRDGGTWEQERDAEAYLLKHANDGADTVAHWKAKRSGKSGGRDF
jgi:hypothetical protein